MCLHTIRQYSKAVALAGMIKTESLHIHFKTKMHLFYFLKVSYHATSLTDVGFLALSSPCW